MEAFWRRVVSLCDLNRPMKLRAALGPWLTKRFANLRSNSTYRLPSSITERRGKAIESSTSVYQGLIDRDLHHGSGYDCVTRSQAARMHPYAGLQAEALSVGLRRAGRVAAQAFVMVSSRTQSTVAPDSFTTLAHLAVSALMKAAN
jgi:hypothetical protein